MTNKPLYIHTISEQETTFIASHNEKDYYYRFNGMEHIIDVRHSNEPSDYVNWVIVDYKGKIVLCDFMNKNIPMDIQMRAINMIGVSF